MVLTKTCPPRARNRLVTFAVIDTKEREPCSDRTEQLENRANRETAKMAVFAFFHLLVSFSSFVVSRKMVVAAIITPPAADPISSPPPIACEQRMNWGEAKPLKLGGISRSEFFRLVIHSARKF